MVPFNENSKQASLSGRAPAVCRAKGRPDHRIRVLPRLEGASQLLSTRPSLQGRISHPPLKFFKL